MFSAPIAPQDSLHPLSHSLPFLFLLSKMQLLFKATYSCSNYSWRCCAALIQLSWREHLLIMTEEESHFGRTNFALSCISNSNRSCKYSLVSCRRAAMELPWVNFGLSRSQFRQWRKKLLWRGHQTPSLGSCSASLPAAALLFSAGPAWGW